MEKFLYCDNAATTKIGDEVFEAMLPYLKDAYGNPSSIYKLGRDSKKAIEIAREKTAKALNADPKEIIFTSGGTESDNWAIRSTAYRLREKGKTHIITTVFEHHAVLHTCEQLEKEGFSVTYVPVSNEGLVSVTDIENAITEETAIVSVMFANNEIGTIQPIKEIAAVCKEKKVIFHTDAVQALGNVPIDLKDLGVDLASFSGHKIHAPKGVGIIYIRKGVLLPNFIHGGGQERAKRAGTENVAGIVGFGVAIENIVKNIPEKIEKLTPIRNKLIDGILTLPHTRLNGSKNERLCGNVNVSIEGIEGESLLLMLDMKGIAASSGSACTSGSLDPSHVLLSLGLVHEVAHSSLRLSISEDFSEQDAEYVLSVIPEIVEKLRKMSPLWERLVSESK
ncbi:cysteine desulfurase IscS [Clostridia bacterium]|nr:cysteine desulfurase IscS [Clostridia bacterium]